MSVSLDVKLYVILYRQTLHLDKFSETHKFYLILEVERDH